MGVAGRGLRVRLGGLCGVLYLTLNYSGALFGRSSLDHFLKATDKKAVLSDHSERIYDALSPTIPNNRRQTYF